MTHLFYVFYVVLYLLWIYLSFHMKTPIRHMEVADHMTPDLIPSCDLWIFPRFSLNLLLLMILSCFYLSLLIAMFSSYLNFLPPPISQSGLYTFHCDGHI